MKLQSLSVGWLACVEGDGRFWGLVRRDPRQFTQHCNDKVMQTGAAVRTWLCKLVSASIDPKASISGYTPRECQAPTCHCHCITVPNLTKQKRIRIRLFVLENAYTVWLARKVTHFDRSQGAHTRALWIRPLLMASGSVKCRDCDEGSFPRPDRTDGRILRRRGRRAHRQITFYNGYAIFLGRSN